MLRGPLPPHLQPASEDLPKMPPASESSRSTVLTSAPTSRRTSQAVAHLEEDGSPTTALCRTVQEDFVEVTPSSGKGSGSWPALKPRHRVVNIAPEDFLDMKWAIGVCSTIMSDPA
ncbi:uncharacterized protein LOC112473686 isoform X2 [Pteropus alecto]|uniref:uncharacterized protein LOC112473686 isoform X2 n=1 Tax=Pteropus alecto TaxID=9402 RepID=UPI000D539CAA|nr:uncharacterized protein LOC112473686 isoform X2 [Pteropus alecto]